MDSSSLIFIPFVGFHFLFIFFFFEKKNQFIYNFTPKERWIFVSVYKKIYKLDVQMEKHDNYKLRSFRLVFVKK